MTGNSFPNLFSPGRIRDLQLANRIVSTAHGTYMPKDGLQTEQIASYQAARARGGVGLIILEATSTHPTGIGAPRYATAHLDACIPGYRMVIDAIHAHQTPAFVQLYHPGHDDIAGSTGDGSRGASYSSSAVLCEVSHVMPRAMSRSLIREVVRSYGAAAKRLQTAGADGIEISAHHGHLICQFFDPRVNRRTDEYGGDFEGRFRLLREIVATVRDSVGEKLIVGVRLTCNEGSAAGMTRDEALEIANAADRMKELDFLHVTPGAFSAFDAMSQAIAPMAYNASYARQDFAALRSVVTKPLLVTGRINDPVAAESLIKDEIADFVGMARALICDPDMPAKARQGRVDEIRYCIACNQACIGHGRRGGFVSCIQNPLTGREQQFAHRTGPAARRKILIVGGGPAGMKAAVELDHRGHLVTLYERSNRLGGQAKLAQLLPGRAEFGGLITNLENELRRGSVSVVLDREVTPALIRAERPDVVVLATGATAYKPALPGIDDPNVLHAWDVLSGKKAGASVVVADATLDWVALGVAEQLAREGCKTRLWVLGYAPGENTPLGVREYALGVLHTLGVEIVPLMRLVGYADRTAYFQHAINQEVVEIEDVDTLLLAYGGTPNCALEDALAGFACETHVIGDCLSPRTAEEAVLEGFQVAYEIEAT